MIVTVAKITDFEKFLATFSTQGVDKRRLDGCKGAELFRDPDDPNRVWAVFDWSLEDYQQFLADPEIPAIARQLALQEPPIELEAAARYDA